MTNNGRPKGVKSHSANEFPAFKPGSTQKVAFTATSAAAAATTTPAPAFAIAFAGLVLFAPAPAAGRILAFGRRLARPLEAMMGYDQILIGIDTDGQAMDLLQLDQTRPHVVEQVPGDARGDGDRNVAAAAPDRVLFKDAHDV